MSRLSKPFNGLLRSPAARQFRAEPVPETDGPDISWLRRCRLMQEGRIRMLRWHAIRVK